MKEILKWLGKWYILRIGFDQKVRFESVSSKFESNLNPCFSYNPDVILEQCLTIFDVENRQKLLQNDNFRGWFLKNLTLSDSNPDFRFYGVEIFTRIEAGFELSQLPNLILNICIFRKIVIDFNLECLFHMIGEEWRFLMLRDLDTCYLSNL